MKNILYSMLSGFIFTALFISCEDVNDQFDELDSLTGITNLAAYNYSLVDADYTAIATAAGDAAASIKTNKYFTTAFPASEYMPYLLKTKYPYSDLGSTAMVTYAFGEDQPTYLSDLTSINILSESDYKLAWGGVNYVSAFTPAKSADVNLPIYLAAKFPAATTGQYKFVEYNYSSIEAITESTEVFYLSEDWTFSEVRPIADYGWLSTDLVGSKNWLNKQYNGNSYAQVSSNGSNEVNENWMISKEIDLTNANAPKFTFNINVGYWNANCLKVLISENFNGTEAGISTATWTDISSKFTLPETPTGAYGVLATAGTADFTAYKGKKVRIAYKYSGDGRSALDRGTDPIKTTTYQVDDIKVSEIKVALSIPSSEKKYAAYMFNGSAWVPADNLFVALQPADYTSLGLPYISSANVPLYLPNFLAQKFPYAIEGNVKNVVYKSSSNENYSGAAQFKFTEGKWMTNSFKINKTEQFVFSNAGWVFDPTIVVPLVKVSGNNKYIMKFIDYIRINTPEKFFQKNTYTNEEHYYGFSAYYSQIICGADRTTYGDEAIKALTTDAEKYTLFLNRVKEAMPLFTQLNFPDLTTDVSGIQQNVIFTINTYYSSSNIGVLTIKMKCTKSGGVTPAEYEVESLVETF